MEYRYIDPDATREVLTKDWARRALQQCRFNELNGVTDDTWTAQRDRLAGVLTEEEAAEFLADVDRVYFTDLETRVIQAEVEGDTKLSADLVAAAVEQYAAVDAAIAAKG